MPEPRPLPFGHEHVTDFPLELFKAFGYVGPEVLPRVPEDVGRWSQGLHPGRPGPPVFPGQGMGIGGWNLMSPAQKEAWLESASIEEVENLEALLREQPGLAGRGGPWQKGDFPPASIYDPPPQRLADPTGSIYPSDPPSLQSTMYDDILSSPEGASWVLEKYGLNVPKTAPPPVGTGGWNTMSPAEQAEMAGLPEATPAPKSLTEQIQAETVGMKRPKITQEELDLRRALELGPSGYSFRTGQTDPGHYVDDMFEAELEAAGREAKLDASVAEEERFFYELDKLMHDSGVPPLEREKFLSRPLGGDRTYEGPRLTENQRREKASREMQDYGGFTPEEAENRVRQLDLRVRPEGEVFQVNRKVYGWYPAKASTPAEKEIARAAAREWSSLRGIPSPGTVDYVPARRVPEADLSGIAEGMPGGPLDPLGDVEGQTRKALRDLGIGGAQTRFFTGGGEPMLPDPGGDPFGRNEFLDRLKRESTGAEDMLRGLRARGADYFMDASGGETFTREQSLRLQELKEQLVELDRLFAQPDHPDFLGYGTEERQVARDRYRDAYEEVGEISSRQQRMMFDDLRADPSGQTASPNWKGTKGSTGPEGPQTFGPGDEFFPASDANINAAINRGGIIQPGNPQGLSGGGMGPPPGAGRASTGAFGPDDFKQALNKLIGEMDALVQIPAAHELLDDLVATYSEFLDAFEKQYPVEFAEWIVEAEPYIDNLNRGKRPRTILLSDPPHPLDVTEGITGSPKMRRKAFKKILDKNGIGALTKLQVRYHQYSGDIDQTSALRGMYKEISDQLRDYIAEIQPTSLGPPDTSSLAVPPPGSVLDDDLADIDAPDPRPRHPHMPKDINAARIDYRGEMARIEDLSMLIEDLLAEGDNPSKEQMMEWYRGRQIAHRNRANLIAYTYSFSPEERRDLEQQGRAEARSEFDQYADDALAGGGGAGKPPRTTFDLPDDWFGEGDDEIREMIERMLRGEISPDDLVRMAGSKKWWKTINRIRQKMQLPFVSGKTKAMQAMVGPLRDRFAARGPGPTAPVLEHGKPFQLAESIPFTEGPPVKPVHVPVQQPIDLRELELFHGLQAGELDDASAAEINQLQEERLRSARSPKPKFRAIPKQQLTEVSQWLREAGAAGDGGLKPARVESLIRKLEAFNAIDGDFSYLYAIDDAGAPLLNAPEQRIILDNLQLGDYLTPEQAKAIRFNISQSHSVGPYESVIRHFRYGPNARVKWGNKLGWWKRFKGLSGSATSGVMRVAGQIPAPLRVIRAYPKLSGAVEATSEIERAINQARGAETSWFSGRHHTPTELVIDLSDVVRDMELYVAQFPHAKDKLNLTHFILLRFAEAGLITPQTGAEIAGIMEHMQGLGEDSPVYRQKLQKLNAAMRRIAVSDSHAFGMRVAFKRPEDPSNAEAFFAWMNRVPGLNWFQPSLTVPGGPANVDDLMGPFSSSMLRENGLDEVGIPATMVDAVTSGAIPAHLVPFITPNTRYQESYQKPIAKYSEGGTSYGEQRGVGVNIIGELWRDDPKIYKDVLHESIDRILDSENTQLSREQVDQLNRTESGRKFLEMYATNGLYSGYSEFSDDPRRVGVGQFDASQVPLWKWKVADDVYQKHFGAGGLANPTWHVYMAWKNQSPEERQAGKEGHRRGEYGEGILASSPYDYDEYFAENEEILDEMLEASLISWPSGARSRNANDKRPIGEYQIPRPLQKVWTGRAMDVRGQPGRARYFPRNEKPDEDKYIRWMNYLSAEDIFPEVKQIPGRREQDVYRFTP